jgi:hypothetical protein
MNTALTWREFHLGMIGLWLLNEVHFFVGLLLNVVFVLLCLSLWIDGSTNIEILHVCIQTNYLIVNCFSKQTYLQENNL